MSPLVYFVRHGQTDWNAENRLQGQADIELNALGREQATQNGRKLAGLIPDPQAFDFVASPMKRTRATMELVRAAMGLDPYAYRTDPRLVEVNFGDWQGFTYAASAASTNGITCLPAKGRKATRCFTSGSSRGSRNSTATPSA
jgi:probable phosphoglycerate mutase